MEQFDNQYVCYIIKSINENNRTYVGSTNKIRRRIRQHNREIKGGAKATGIGFPYEIICLVTGFKDKITALKCEWLLKHPTGKRHGNSKYYGIEGRLNGVNHLFLNSEKWRLLVQDLDMKVLISERYAPFIEIPYQII